MIKIDSVLALNNSFVTVERLLPEQVLMGVTPTKLLKVLEDIDYGILVETDYYSIIVSPHQPFIVSPTEFMEAQNLQTGDKVLTVYGFQPITLILPLNRQFNMADIYTQSKLFLSEGFYLVHE